MSIEIEKDVPLSKKCSQNGGPHKYPWKDMVIGDSFFIAGAKQVVISSAANREVRAHGGKYTTRLVDGGVRVWRIE